MVSGEELAANLLCNYTMTENGLNLNDRIVQNRVIQQHQQDRGQERVLSEHRETYTLTTTLKTKLH
uniref:Uncharacterized protein n=1 Tax=Megaselia scalaris TaxID=36166 RepID=T1H3F4_MEGSC